MANVRTFYACQKVALGAPSGSDGGVSQDYKVLNGIQSVGITTNYNLDPVYQLGRLEPGDLYEDIPDVEVSLTKALDGTNTIYQQMMGEGTLTALSDQRSAVQLSIYPQENTRTTGTATAVCTMIPAYLGSITYNFPAEGNFTEEASIVANSKTWGGTADDDVPDANMTGVARRQFLNTASCLFPTGNADGPFNSGSLPSDFKLQSISVSVDFGREEIYQLGERLPFTRYINFPVEVTSEFEVISALGDNASGSETAASCSNPKALMDQAIKVVLCDGMTLDLKSKNKLNSVSTAGGDAGGDNVTYTYSYINYNDFQFTAPGEAVEDPTTNKLGDFEQVDLDNYGFTK